MPLLEDLLKKCGVKIGDVDVFAVAKGPGSFTGVRIGVCAVKGGDLDGALAFLAQYKPAKGAAAEIINAQNLGLQGDIYVEKGDLKKGAEFYNKAVEASNNSLTAPYYLKKLGGIYEAQGDKAGALKAYRTILDSYAQSLEARDIEKYIGTIQ